MISDYKYTNIRDRPNGVTIVRRIVVRILARRGCTTSLPIGNNEQK